jgi:uncharacterized membrane protein
MSLETGRKLGLTASLIYIILPIIAIIGAAGIVLSLISITATGIGTGTSTPAFTGVFGSFILFIIIVAVAGIVGFILFFVAMYNLSNYYNDPEIFKNVLYAFILSIISGVLLFALEFVFILSSIASFPQVSTTRTVFPILGYIAVFGASIVFAIINGWLYMRAFNKLKEKSGVDNFGTAGLLYLIGAIIPLVIWIAWIFAAMGFQKLKSVAMPTVFYSNQTPSPNTTLTKPRPNCGTRRLRGKSATATAKH